MPPIRLPLTIRTASSSRRSRHCWRRSAPVPDGDRRRNPPRRAEEMATHSDPPSTPDPAAAPSRGRFEEIYDAQVVPIYRFIYGRVGNAPEAEDLTAQVFMRAVE